MELEELVAGQIQTLQAADRAQGLEDHDWAAHGWERAEVVAAEVELFEVLEVEHVVGQLLQVVRGQVENAQVLADVEVADGLVVQLVVGQVEHFERVEVLVAQCWNLENLVELQVEVLEVLQVAQLFHADLIVGQVERRQVLEVAQVLLDDINDLLRRQLRLDSLVRQSDSAREQDEETVEKKTEALRHLANIALSLLALTSLVPLEAFLGLHWVDDVRDDHAAHRQWLAGPFSNRRFQSVCLLL